MSEEERTNRPRYQLHLSTAVALMVVIGALTGVWLWMYDYFGTEASPSHPQYSETHYNRMVLFAFIYGAICLLLVWLTILVGELLARRRDIRAKKLPPP